MRKKSTSDIPGYKKKKDSHWQRATHSKGVPAGQRRIPWQILRRDPSLVPGARLHPEASPKPLDLGRRNQQVSPGSLISPGKIGLGDVLFVLFVIRAVFITLNKHHLLSHNTHLTARKMLWRLYRIGGATGSVSEFVLADDILCVEWAISRGNKEQIKSFLCDTYFLVSLRT